jgi:TatD DNase family protein
MRACNQYDTQYDTLPNRQRTQIMSKKARREIPVFDHPIIETHCHLDYLPSEAIPQTLQQARDVGVERIVTIAVSPENLATVLTLAEQHDNVWCSQGVHPHEAEAFSEQTACHIAQQLAHDKVVAVGEIGLDYYYDHADRNQQRAVFERQLQLAVDAGMPVVIHTRDADDDCAAILSNFSSLLGASGRSKGVIHSFTSGLKLAQYCLDEGFMLGFNGITTFNRADNVREVVAATPLEQLVLETDAPYLTPVPYRGKPNAPHYLPFIAEKVAAVKGIGIDRLLQAAHANSQRLFFTPTTGS